MKLRVLLAVHGMLHCSFEHNEATGTSGGAWYASLKTAVTYKVAGCYFGENLSAAHGGAILSTSKNATFTNCTFYKNEITGANNGGGALALQGDATIYNCTFISVPLKWDELNN